MVLLLCKKGIQYLGVDAAAGNLPPDFVLRRKQGQIDLPDRTGDVLLQNLRQVLSRGSGILNILVPAVGQPKHGQGSDEEAHQQAAGYQSPKERGGRPCQKAPWRFPLVGG